MLLTSEEKLALITEAASVAFNINLNLKTAPAFQMVSEVHLVHAPSVLQQFWPLFLQMDLSFSRYDADKLSQKQCTAILRKMLKITNAECCLLDDAFSLKSQRSWYTISEGYERYTKTKYFVVRQT